jgi:hypothetical protein
MKCIQLIPAQFNASISYSVENYIVKKVANCYDVASYNSPSTILFSNQCYDVCPDKYCLLFNNQPNTSIINIFYSGSSASSAYALINPMTNYLLSYDYLFFDSCPSIYDANRIYLIVVYVLAGVIGVLTIGVILKFIICAIIKKLHPDADLTNWQWLLDFLLGRLPPKDDQENRHEPEPSSLYIIDNDIRPKVKKNPLHSTNNLNTSSQQHIISSSSSHNTSGQRNDRRDRGGSSSDPRQLGASSENGTPTIHRHIISDYILNEDDLESNHSLDAIENPHQIQTLPILQKLAARLTGTLSNKSIPNGYEALEAKPSPDYSIVRL